MSEKNEYVMKLSRPIEIVGQKVSEIRIKDPKAGALKNLNLSFNQNGLQISIGDLIGVIAAAAEIPESSVEELAMNDLLSNMTGIISFFGVDIPMTG